MSTLFGLDIAALVNDSIAAAGGVLDLTLIKVTPGTRTPGQLTGGTNPTSISHAGKGFIDDRTEARREGTLVETGGRVVVILGASLPSGVVPGTGDKVTIESTTYGIVGPVRRDPAAATYECTVEV